MESSRGRRRTRHARIADRTPRHDQSVEDLLQSGERESMLGVPPLGFGPGLVQGYVAHSGLPKALVDLVYLRVSQINGCAYSYCIDLHSRDLLKDGLAVEKLVLVPAWREAGSLFSEQERGTPLGGNGDAGRRDGHL